ncbi:hypothetical protein PR048_029313 [Dryococelus australis]|uniref:Uncharacterized protein n=1 Tax=Dryococelus australis TaxID=614101 RepID=A0ABQ9GD16_9NEOP|nr:hypothetical protein PR048_029313 [Dryococelus australis]
MLQRELVEDVKKCIYYGLISDSTTDISAQEQFTFCLRYVDQVSLVVEEVFLGMYDCPGSRADTLSFLLSLISSHPKAIFVHCSYHALDLALQDIGRKNSICDVLVVVKDVSTFILESAKRKTTYLIVVLNPCNETKISSLVFGPWGQIATAIQSPDYIAAGAKHAPGVLKTTKVNLLNDDTFDDLWDEVESR